MRRLCLPLLLLSAVTAGAAERPNIVFIFSDDHAPHAIGACSDWLKALDPTPNIDRLASRGMLFRNSFCTNSICGPSRAVILTGKHSHLNGFMNNGNRFDADQQTFPKLLRQAGYQTALFGKWHLQSLPQGFDRWEILPGQGEYYNPRFITPEGTRRETGHCTDLVADKTVRWLRDGRDPDKPFVLMCQHKAPHRNWMPAERHLTLYDGVDVPEPDTLFDDYADNARPARIQEMEIGRHMHPVFDLFFDPPPDFDPEMEEEAFGSVDRSYWRNRRHMTADQLAAWDAAYGPKNAAFAKANPQGKKLVRAKYQRYMKNYLRCVRGVDECVGRVVAELESLGLADNTVVIYSSDQGFYLGDHGWYDKRWMYEESLKMPLIVHWPGVTAPGGTSDLMVQNLDYAPTFLEMAGVGIPGDMQGRSLAPLLAGVEPADWRDAIYYHFYEFPSVHMVAKHNGVRTERFKLLHFYQFGEWEFYDLREDPKELHNQYGNPAYADDVARLKDRLEELRTRYGDDTVTEPMPADWQDRFGG